MYHTHTPSSIIENAMYWSVSRNIRNYRANFAFIVFDYIKSSQYSKRCYILFVSKLRFKLDYISLQSVFHLYHKEPQVLDSVLKYCELIGQKWYRTCVDKNDIITGGIAFLSIYYQLVLSLSAGYQRIAPAESEAIAGCSLAGDRSVWKGKWTILRWITCYHLISNKIKDLELSSKLKGVWLSY